MAQVKSEIASHVKAILADKNMTIKELSERADLHYTTARRFVDGTQENINKTILAKVCAALGCSIGDIFTHAPNEPDTD